MWFLATKQLWISLCIPCFKVLPFPKPCLLLLASETRPRKQTWKSETENKKEKQKFFKAFSHLENNCIRESFVYVSLVKDGKVKVEH